VFHQQALKEGTNSRKGKDCTGTNPSRLSRGNWLHEKICKLDELLGGASLTGVRKGGDFKWGGPPTKRRRHRGKEHQR